MANTAWTVNNPRSRIFFQGWNQNQESRHQKRLRVSPPSVCDLRASPLRLVSSKCNDPQMIAAGQINPVRAGSREDGIHLRFKAPPSSPQVISCHSAPQEKDRADSRWKLCKATVAGRRGPSWCSAPRCSWGDRGPSTAQQPPVPLWPAVHSSKAQGGESWLLWTSSCAEVSPARLYNCSETAANLHSGERESYSPCPSVHKCTVSHWEISLQKDCWVLVF